jgi:hypothetical protein
MLFFPFLFWDFYLCRVLPSEGARGKALLAAHWLPFSPPFLFLVFPSSLCQPRIQDQGRARGRVSPQQGVGVEQGVGLAFSLVSQPRPHWSRFFADLKVVAGFSPRHHLPNKPESRAHLTICPKQTRLCRTEWEGTMDCGELDTREAGN